MTSALNSAIPTYDTNIASYPIVTRLSNEALARFTGKVRKHNASLGVTIASWRQASEMIHSRSEKIATVFDRHVRLARKLTSRQKDKILLKNTANAFLEGEFGWVPLVEDIQKGIGALGQNPMPQYFSATSRGVDIKEFNNFNNNNLTIWTKRLQEEQWRVRVSGRMIVESENAWVSNRLGLLNLPGVAWDLVPWTFVVNMFTNMGQMVNSLTDFAGMEIDLTSTTVSLYAQAQAYVYGNKTWGYAGTGWNQCFDRHKKRTLGLPVPKFMWRVPELNLELLAIAAALPLQRLKTLTRVLDHRGHYQQKYQLF
jgi:hypothetical protein